MFKSYVDPAERKAADRQLPKLTVEDLLLGVDIDVETIISVAGGRRQMIVKVPTREGARVTVEKDE